MNRTRPISAALLVSLLALTAACGESDDTDAASEETPTEATAEGCEGVEAADTGAIELTDAFGRTVELDGPAERVAVLEWQMVEDVLSLCLPPVAVADVDGYGLWDTAEELPEGVADVGTRGEPNLDALFATNPDLVIIEAYAVDDAIIGQLEEYDIPVLATKGADAADPVGQMLETFDLIAQATGRTERAEAVVEEFETALADAKAEVAAADLGVTRFVYFDGYLDGGNVAIRPFGQGSLIGELGEALGLENAWTGEVDPAYGLGQTDIEGMTAVGDAAFFHTSTIDEGVEVIQELQKNEVWKSLPAVAEDRVYGFPAGTWTFGGPRSAIQVLEAYVDLLTS
jgi:iron complex transport system substrate-binding protein